ncbi:MAG: protein arginine kinase [Planctomycetes bacterium]|nr:protein arginine kinase [Planctomycetota bacterium]
MSDIVISSRIRLARNLATFPFQRKLSRNRQQDLVAQLATKVTKATAWPSPLTLQMTELSEVERAALVERQLISRDLATGKRPAAVHVSPDETCSLMINEEDHLRLQVITPGLSLRKGIEQAVALDQSLEPHVEWAVHPQYGYLSACPTNTGTGLRASVMLHLPALAETQELRQVLRGLGKLHMTVRGLHGEGSEASGHYYQVSNQRSLGSTEQEIVDAIVETVDKIVAYEELARQALLDNNRPKLEDRAWRAWGLLTHARTLTYDELIDQLSWLRLGAALAILPAQDWTVLDRIFLQGQPAHLQLQHDHAAIPEARDRLRADLVRGWLLG